LQDELEFLRYEHCAAKCPKEIAEIVSIVAPLRLDTRPRTKRLVDEMVD
jgi:hypothetical protein